MPSRKSKDSGGGTQAAWAWQWSFFVLYGLGVSCKAIWFGCVSRSGTLTSCERFGGFIDFCRNCCCSLLIFIFGYPDIMFVCVCVRYGTRLRHFIEFAPCFEMGQFHLCVFVSPNRGGSKHVGVSWAYVPKNRKSVWNRWKKDFRSPGLLHFWWGKVSAEKVAAWPLTFFCLPVHSLFYWTNWSHNQMLDSAHFFQPY